MKTLIASMMGCLAWIQVMAGQMTAQPMPPEIESPEDMEWHALADSLRHVSLAYRSVAIQYMLAEANDCAARLHLPMPYPIQPADFREIRVVPPWFCRLDSTNTHLSKINRVRAAQIPAAGHIRTTNMVFSFSKGTLGYLSRLNEEGLEYHPRLGTKVVINDAEAYQLATQNLSIISMDVAALEKRLKPKVWRQRYGKSVQPKEDVASFYTVQWGDEANPAVRVTIDGTTKELLAIDIQDASYSLRPRLIITNAMELLNQPDPPKVRLQRSSQAQTNAPDSTNPMTKSLPFHRESPTTPANFDSTNSPSPRQSPSIP